MNSAAVFSQLVSSVTDYQGKILQARKTLEAIHASLYEGIKPELQKLGQYTQDLQFAQILSAAASKSEVAKYQALIDTARSQVANVQGVLAEKQASYRICKAEQDDNIEKWVMEIGKINRQLSTFQDF